MKNKLLLLLAITVTMTSCYRVNPNGGTESVLIYKPYFFGHGGVERNPISVGSTWCAWTTSHIDFSIVPETYTEKFKDMIPSDNTPVSFNAYIKIEIQSGNTPMLYEKFGQNWYENSIMESFRTMVRDQASRYKMFELASKREISTIIQDSIYKSLSNYCAKINLPVNIMQVIIGAIVPPSEVLDETKNTAAQNQSILTQKARADAELSRKQAEINKAIADQSYKNQMGMTVEEYLHLRQLEIEKEKVELIKDKNNVSIIFGGSIPITYPIK